MHKMTKMLCVAAFAASCTWAAPAMSADEAFFKTAYDAALAATQKAASIGYEWRDTRKLLRKAKKAADKGDFAKAEKMANSAKFQSDAAYAQGQDQEVAWKAAVLR